MKIAHPNSDLGFTIMHLSFADWLEMKEIDCFEIDHEQSRFWQHIPALQTYATTVAVIKVSDTIFKLNGRGRKQAWLNGDVPAPDQVIALVYELSESEFLDLCAEAGELRRALLPSNEVIKEAYLTLGLNLTSERLRKGFITEAIHIALRGRQRELQDKRSLMERNDINMERAIALFRNELLTLDALDPDPNIFTSGVLAGALIMLGLDKPVTAFLERLNQGQGEKKDGQLDPVASLMKAIHRNNVSRTRQPRMAIELCKKTVNAMSLWLEGQDSSRYWRTRDLVGQNVTPFIMALKQIKQVDGQSDL